jgi:membrane AbrB-like protein
MFDINITFLQSRLTQWIILILLSAIFISLLKYMALPAAILLGAMISAIILSIKGATIRVNRLYFYFAQAVIGCLIAKMFIIDIFTDFLQKWPMFLGFTLAILIASYLIGFCISKLNRIHHTTAFWGLLPGASSVIILMSDGFGADSRLVAFMQYVRVLLVASSASLIVHFYIQLPETVGITPSWFPNIHWHIFGISLGLIAMGILVGHFTPLPAGAILVPFVIGSILHAAGIIELELPPWLLTIAYIFLGWTIGMRFTQSTLSHALATLPQTLSAIIALMLFCALLAYLLVVYWGVDPITAYLATSPGGMDSIAIIAASTTTVDMPFIVTLQTMRFLVILFIGPPISQWLAKYVDAQVKASISVPAETPLPPKS